MIAALLVFFHHFNSIDATTAPNLSARLIAEGHIGVNIFFVLSGFLITLRYLNNVKTHTFSYREYLIKRIARIMPLYFVLLVASILLQPAPLPLVNFTFTQSYFHYLKFTGIPTAWSLSVEEAFYLIAPICFWLILRYRALAMIALRLLLIVLLFFGIGLGLTYLPIAKLPPYGFMVSVEHFAWYTLFGRMFDFAAGIFAAVIYLRFAAPSRKWATALFVGGVSGIAMLEIGMSLTANYATSWIYNFPIAVCAAALIWSLTKPDTLPYRLLNQRLLVYGGRISYALYLVQLTPMIAPLFPLGITSPILLYVLMNIISAGLYELIEHPAHRLILRYFSAARPRVTLQPAIP